MLRLLSLLCLVGITCTCRADGNANVSICFLGGEKRTPLEGLAVTVHTERRSPSQSDSRKPAAQGSTDNNGAVAVALPPGRYFVEIVSKKPLPYLPLPVGYRGYPGYYERTIEVQPGASQRFDFHLADACELTLKAVDADTGKPLSDVKFVTENAAGEIWGTTIYGDNLGRSEKEDEARKTDADGVFRQLVGPGDGYTYFAWPAPEGYKPVGPHEVEIPTPLGRRSAEHVFRFRRIGTKSNDATANKPDSKSEVVEPQDWPEAFAKRINAADAAGAAELYDPKSRIARPNGVIEGRDEVRKLLAGLVESHARMRPTVRKVVENGDVALLYTDFEITLSDSNGKEITRHDKAIELLRRQPDGTWLLVFGDPTARNGD